MNPLPDTTREWLESRGWTETRPDHWVKDNYPDGLDTRDAIIAANLGESLDRVLKAAS